MYTSISSLFRNTTLPLLLIIGGVLFFAAVAIANIVSGSSQTNTSTDITLTQLDISRPNDVVPGDLMLANITVNGGSPATITAPSGWTLIARTDNDTSIGIASYWKIAGASESTTYTWNITPQTRAAGGITRYSGINSNNPIDTSAGTSGRGTTATTPSITTTVPNTQVVTLFAIDAGTVNSPAFTAPVGMTEKYSIKNTPFGPTTAVYDALQTSTGTSGTKSSTVSQSPRDWVAQLIALRPFIIPTPISYWRFDESNGNAVDSAGTNILTNNNSAPFVSGKINNGVDLELGSSQFFSITDISQAGLDLSGDLTFAGWVKFESLPTSPITFINKRLATENQRSYSFTYQGLNDSPASSFEFAWFQTGSSVGGQQFQAWSPSTGVWYHIAITKSDSTSKIYINGSQLGGDYTGSNATIFNGTADFYVGRNEDGGFMDGVMDEWGVWDRALTASEISQLYNTGIGLQYPF